MFIKAKYICSYAQCEKFYPFEKNQYHNMFECIYRSIICIALGCKLIINVETVIYHFINCSFICYIAQCVNDYSMYHCLPIIAM